MDSPTTPRRNVLRRIAPALAVLFVAVLAAAHSEASGVAARLDTAEVRRHYLDGDFDPAIEHLKTALKEVPAFTRRDSLFIFKHLGVMYAAQPETRERGRYYLRLLLEADPKAQIYDMYVSDLIYTVFKNVQGEVEASRPFRPERDTLTRKTLPGNGPQPVPAKRKQGNGLRTAVWWGATAAVLGAGVAAYYVLSEPKEIPGKDFTVPHR